MTLFFLKILVLVYLVSFFTPIILFTESNEIIKTLIIYALITIFFLLLDHFFKNKKSYLNFLIKFSLVISLSTLIIDLYHIYKYQNDPIKNIQLVSEKNENEHQSTHKVVGTSSSSLATVNGKNLMMTIAAQAKIPNASTTTHKRKQSAKEVKITSNSNGGGSGSGGNDLNCILLSSQSKATKKDNKDSNISICVLI